MRVLSLRTVLAFTAAAFLATAASADNHGATKVRIITGTDWVASDERAKVGFLYGVANFVEVEHAMYGDKMPGDRESLVPVLVRGMGDRTIEDVKDDLDAWYSQNPDRLDRPLIETIWYELALPNS